MENRPVLMIVGTRLVAAEERERFEQWYDEHHIPLFLKVPGFVRADRYEEITATSAREGTNYLVVYQLANEASLRGMWETPERERATQQRVDAWGNPPKGYEVRFQKYYRPVGK